MVACKVCGKKMFCVSYRHLELHKMTTKEYKKKFPGEKTTWNEGEKGIQVAWNKDLTKETDDRLKVFSERRKGSPCYRTPERLGEERYREGEARRIKKLSKYLKSGKSRFTSKEIHAKGVATRKLKYANYFSDSGLKTIKENNGNKVRLESMTPKEKIEYGNMRREIVTKWWASLTQEERSEMYRKIFTRREPSGQEKKFQKNYIDKYDLPFIYTGQIKDKKIDIGGRIPDYLHLSEKKIIEIYGDCYHLGEDPQDKIDHYKDYGYDCVVIWASELKNEDLVLSKIRSL